MFPKRAVITALLGLNLLLLAALILSGYSMPAAQAQDGFRLKGRAGDFVAVTALAPGQPYEVLYILDSKRRIHAFFPKDVTSQQLDYVGFRDLDQDLRK